jgi:hypothetical protein
MSMSNSVSRARAWALSGLLAYAPLAASQTMEIITGGARFVDVPGISVPVMPTHMAVGPDGALYVLSGRLMRLNVAQGTVTALPTIAGGLNFSFFYAAGMAFDPAGALNVAVDGALYRVDIDAGTTTNLGNLDEAGPMVFAADGTLFYVSGDHRVRARLPSGEIIVIAGTGFDNFAGDGGPAPSANLDTPRGIAIGPDGDLYIADTGNSRIRKISRTTGIITTYAGTGAFGFNGDGLPALQANITQPQAIVFDASGNLFAGGYGDFRIRRIDAVSGLVSTVAGTGESGMTGDGGPALAARVTEPGVLALDAAGRLFFADHGAYSAVRKLTTSSGIVTRVMGNDSYLYCGDNVPAAFACFSQARGLDVDTAGNLLIADGSNNRVRRISAANGRIATLANVINTSPVGIEHDAAGNTYFSSPSSPHRVYRIDAITGISSVFAGAGGFGSAGDGGLATSAMLASPHDQAVDSAGNVFIADRSNHRIRKVDAVTRIITTYAGNGFPATPNSSFSGDGSPATSVNLNNPRLVEIDPAGNLVISDGLTCRLRKVNAITRVITTIAGNGFCTTQNPGDGALATATSIGTYPAFAFDPAGNIFLSWSNQIRRIDAATGIISSVAAPAGGLRTAEGLGFLQPESMEFDADGRLYLTDYLKPYVFRISGLIDSTPPTIEPNIVGTAGNGGWYRGDVQVGWAVNDAESSVRSSSGCTASSVTEDTAGITFTCTATSFGGTASSSVTIRRDTVAPQLTFDSPSPAPDASGWNSTDVSVPFNATDELSGVYSTSHGSPLTIEGAGSGLTASVVVTDFAGNSATFTSPAVNIDRSPPEVVGHVSGTLGSNDWYTSDVQVSWTVNAGASPVSSSEGCETSNVTADTAGVTFTCTASSAGGANTQTVTIKRDATAPHLEFGAPSPAPDVSGWFGGDVTFPFMASDATSGVSSPGSSGSVVVTGTGTGLTSQVTVTDGAGNSATFTTPAVNIANNPPVITAQLGGTLGSNGWYRSNVQVSWNVDGGGSPITSSAGCEPGNVTANTTGITFTCTATSPSGTSTESVTVKRDATAPTLTFGTRTPAPNSRGWNNTNVSFPFTASDALSGVASTSTPSPVVITGSGAGITAQVTVTDQAGNSAVFTTAAVNIDRTVAVITPGISGTLGTNGWYRSNVQLTWTVDELPASIDWVSGCGTYNVNSDTTGISYTCGVQSAGGFTSKTVSIKRDATAPAITITRPANGATYALGQSVTGSFNCTDARMQSCSGTTANGAPLDTSTPGTKTFTVNAVDLAGNTSTLARSYTVQ